MSSGRVCCILGAQHGSVYFPSVHGSLAVETEKSKEVETESFKESLAKARKCRAVGLRTIPHILKRTNAQIGLLLGH